MFVFVFLSLGVAAVLLRLYSGEAFVDDDTLPYIFSLLAAVFATEVIGKLHAILEAIKENNAK